MTTQFFQRPSAGYTGEAGLPNRTKYNDDSTASPRRAISSVKVDGDINYLIDAVNALYDTAISGVVADGAITNAKLRDSAGLSVIGRSANSSGDPADIIAATDKHVLRRSGTTLGFGQIEAGAYGSGSIAAADIADGAVTSGKILDGSVTSAKCGSGAATASQALFANGTGGATYRGMAPNDLPARTQVVLTSGTSWSVPSNVTQVRARLWGGGGGGGSAQASNTHTGGGGGAGGYCEALVSVTPGGTVTYAVGAAGSGGAAGSNNGGNGGTTTFGSLTANGGTGGAFSTAWGSNTPGGAGGTASGGTINLTGQEGGGGWQANGIGYISGQGGNAPQGMGFGGASRAQQVQTEGTGPSATGFGAGGAGGWSQGTAQAGGNGSAGVIILDY